MIRLRGLSPSDRLKTKSRETAEGASGDVVMVGLVPPPYHGQSVLTQALFDSDLSPMRVVRVEARFNREIGEVSAFQWRKIGELLRVITACLRARFRSGAPVLYYTPGSAKWVPFFKDALFLSVTRPFFRRILLHYHSGGLPDFLRHRWWTRALGRWVYGRKAWALALTDEVEVPDESFGAARKIVLPNGIKGVPEDAAIKPARIEGGRSYRLVFLGNLYQEKGILDALEAVLAAAGRIGPERRLEFRVAGAEPDPLVSAAVAERVASLPGNVAVEVLGPIDSKAKWELLRWGDAMLFPSYYGSENFPLVLLEAMACGLPILATRWRGIPAIVSDEETGRLVEVGDVQGLAGAIADLALDDSLQNRMGVATRQAFEAHYAWPTFLSRMKACFDEALAEAR